MPAPVPNAAPGCGSSSRRSRPRHRAPRRSDEARGVPVAGRRELGRGACERRRGVGGPTRWEPQRSCSLAARSPVSYVPIETLAPWYEVSSWPRRATSGTSDAIRTVASRGTTGSEAPREARAGPRHECSDRRALEEHAGLGQRALHDGDDSEGLDEPQRAPDERDRHPSAEPRLRAGGRLTVPSGSRTAAPTRSAHARARHSGAPCLRGAISPCCWWLQPVRPDGSPPNERRSTRRRGISPALRGGAPRAGRPPPRGAGTAGRRPRSRHHLADGRRGEDLVRRVEPLERRRPGS